MESDKPGCGSVSGVERITPSCEKVQAIVERTLPSVEVSLGVDFHDPWHCGGGDPWSGYVKKVSFAKLVEIAVIPSHLELPHELTAWIGKDIETDDGIELSYLSNTGIRTVPARRKVFKLVSVESKLKAWITPPGDGTLYQT